MNPIGAFFESEIGIVIRAKINAVPIPVQLAIISASILTFRSSLDYFGLTLYVVAFILGAIWMATTAFIFLCLYYYLTTPKAPEPENTTPEVCLGEKLLSQINVKQPPISVIAARDRDAEVRIKGRLVVQLEGSASDAAKIPVEFCGSTLFVSNLNGNPNKQAIVIEGAYMRQLDDRTLEIIHPTRSMWQKEDYIYLRFNSSPKRQYWQSALSIVCRKYSDVYQNPEHFEVSNEMIQTFNGLIKEYENIILKNPGVGQQASTVINALLHRIWINITNSRDIKRSLLQKLIEKIDVKLTFAAEAGKVDNIREIAVTDLNLGTRVPFFKDLRVDPSTERDAQNRDFILRTHLAYVDGNLQIGFRINVKHNIPLLPNIFHIVAVIRHFELDLKITALAHPLKRFEITCVEEPLIDLEIQEGKELRKIPGWEAWLRDKVRKMINEALNEKLGEILLTPERQYVNMPGVDSDDEVDESEEHSEGLTTTVGCAVSINKKEESKKKKKNKKKGVKDLERSQDTDPSAATANNKSHTTDSEEETDFDYSDWELSELSSRRRPKEDLTSPNPMKRTLVTAEAKRKAASDAVDSSVGNSPPQVSIRTAKLNNLTTAGLFSPRKRGSEAKYY